MNAEKHESKQPLIEVKGLCKQFGSLKVLNGIDTTIYRGEKISIIGPSGSGKSTLAIELAAAVNCLDKSGKALPCGECDSCRRVYEGNYPDVKILSKPKDRATLGVEAVKDPKFCILIMHIKHTYMK